MSTNLINVVIDHMPIAVTPNTTILEAAMACGVDIPHLCWHPDQSIKANCRICVVEIKGSRKLSAACSTRVWEGMEVLTSSRKVRDMQKGILELIMADHNQDCLQCLRSGSCELQDLCERFAIRGSEVAGPWGRDAAGAGDRAGAGAEPGALGTEEDTNPSLVRDMSKCVKCGRCVEACQSVQEVHVLTHAHRSSQFAITSAYGDPLTSTLCVYCGQCAAVCPTGAIVEKDDTEAVWQALEESGKHVIVQVAPSVRVALGDAFGMPAGANVTGKMVASLKRLGFNAVFDTNFTADLTIVEEAHELVHRITSGGVLPMLTSCSPGWVNYVSGAYADLKPHISTCKSPQQMFGALSKSFYAKKLGISPSEIVTVSIMPCTAKKFEAARPEMSVDGNRDVDIVLTTRELARMIKQAGIVFGAQAEMAFDAPFGIATGAGAIFGASGGVMEAALRTAYALVTGKELEAIRFEDVRGFAGVKEATVQIGDLTLRVAAASGLAHAKQLMEGVRSGTSPYHFIEVMACPGGCLGGGGQPIISAQDLAPVGAKAERMAALYAIDDALPLAMRSSHKNPQILALYKEFLGEPGGHMAHKLLHVR